MNAKYEIQFGNFLSQKIIFELIRKHLAPGFPLLINIFSEIIKGYLIKTK